MSVEVALTRKSNTIIIKKTFPCTVLQCLVVLTSLKSSLVSTTVSTLNFEKLLTGCGLEHVTVGTVVQYDQMDNQVSCIEEAGTYQNKKTKQKTKKKQQTNQKPTNKTKQKTKQSKKQTNQPTNQPTNQQTNNNNNNNNNNNKKPIIPHHTIFGESVLSSSLW